MSSEPPSGALCGIRVDSVGRVHRAIDAGAGPRLIEESDFAPFAWVSDKSIVPEDPEWSLTNLDGPGLYRWRVSPPDAAVFEDWLKKKPRMAVESIRPPEHVWLLQHRSRLFADLSFARLRRCQLDIETGQSGEGSFSNPRRAGDRVLAIGLRCGGGTDLLELEDDSDEAEKRLLESLNGWLASNDPDVIEGHNIFKFDLDFLRQRAKRHRVPCAWGRFGQHASFRASRFKVAERWIDFPRADLPGRAVVDTYLMVQAYDISAREMTSYGLKEAAVYFGITAENNSERTYIAGDEIHRIFQEDRARFRAYLEDDLRETAGIADLLLPTYYEQTRTIPILLQEALLRGTAAKIELLFLEEYYHAGRAIPAPVAIESFEGGFTRSFQEGVFRCVLHFDVASLYPSVLLMIGRNPASDDLGVFIPLLKRLKEYRLECKRLAREAPTAEERREMQARQATYKILINSFYGYLGFSGARFGDGELAAEVTRRGRDLLKGLIEEFDKLGCVVLEADTDGIYLSSEKYFDNPEALLERVNNTLPDGIDLEFDGRYEAMLCYKAKNYALREGNRIILKGSALRSRGIEPFLKELSDALISHLLGLTDEGPLERAAALRREIREGTIDVGKLAKSEILGQNPDTYEKMIAAGGKPRRASAEAALQLSPRPRMGDRVTYYILSRQPGKTADWQRARPVELFDPAAAPLDPDYYLKKIDDWEKRYATFLGGKTSGGQGELGLE